MGCQPAVGIAAQDVHIHLGALEPGGLLPEAQHLLRLEAAGQRDAKPLRIGAAAALLVQLGRRQPNHRRQAISQGRPLGITHLPRLDVEVVGEPAGGQHLAMTIQKATPDRVAGQQPDSVFIGPGAVLSAMQQLQPGQARHHGTAEQQHHSQQQGRLTAHAGVTGGGWTKGHGQALGSSRCSSCSSRAAMRAKPCCSSKASWGSAISVATSWTSTFITGLPRPGLTRSKPWRS